MREWNNVWTEIYNMRGGREDGIFGRHPTSLRPSRAADKEEERRGGGITKQSQDVSNGAENGGRGGKNEDINIRKRTSTALKRGTHDGHTIFPSGR